MIIFNSKHKKAKIIVGSLVVLVIGIFSAVFGQSKHPTTHSTLTAAQAKFQHDLTAALAGHHDVGCLALREG